MIRRFWIVAVLTVALTLAGCRPGVSGQETMPDSLPQEGTESHVQTTVPETTQQSFDGEVEVDFSDFEDMQPDTTVAGSDFDTETSVPVQPETTVPVPPQTTAPVPPQTTAPVPPQTTAPIPPETTLPEKPVVRPTEADEELITEETTVATTEQPPAPTETVPPTTAEPVYGSDGYNNQVVRP